MESDFYRQQKQNEVSLRCGDVFELCYDDHSCRSDKIRACFLRLILTSNSLYY
ncbi:hypothetical protein KW89_3p59 (plasmid) [Piscirickettsia salmonis]|nr:hypothetical protein KW89_3p59 [Piscirickettsia salmonis]